MEIRRLKKAKLRTALLLCLAGLLIFTITLNAVPDRSGKTLTWTRSFGFRVHALNSESGLPQNTVQSLTQTRDGFMWMATQEGLARYDGHSTVVFDTMSNPELQSSHFYQVLARRNGELWVSTWPRGLFLMAGNRFIQQNSVPAAQNVLIEVMKEDAHGNLWIGSHSGLFVLTARGIQKKGLDFGLADPHVGDIAVDKNGGVWVATRTRGIQTLKNGQFEPVPHTSGNCSDCRLAVSAAGDLWIARGSKLIRIHAGKKTVFTNPEFSAIESIQSIMYDSRDNTLWLGTHDDGVWLFKDNSFSPTEFSGQTGVEVYSIIKDDEGSVWAGTGGSGVRQFSPGNIISFSEPEGLSSSILWSVIQAQDNSVWVTTNGRGVNRILPDGRVEEYGLKSGLTNLITSSICQTSDLRIWAGTEGSGLFVLKNRRFARFDLSDNQDDNNVWALFEDRSGTLWVGTGGDVFSIKSGKLTRYHTDSEHAVVPHSVRGFTQDPSGKVWMASDSGLFCFENNTFSKWTTRDGLSLNTLLSVVWDDPDTLWISTRNGGLNLFHNGTISYLTMQQGLPSNLIHHIVPDGQGNLYMSCNRGIFKIGRTQLIDAANNRIPRIIPRIYGSADGMRNPECNGGRFPAGTIIRQGYVCFPTMDGLACLNVQNHRQTFQPPRVLIDEVRIGQNAIDLFKKNVQVKSGDRGMEIHYTAFDYVAPNQLNFRSRLLPLQRKWNEAGKSRIERLSSIPPGKHRYEVTARRGNGKWNPVPAYINIIKLPNFFQTIWFKFLIVLALAGLTLGWAHLRTRSLRIRESKLKQLVDEKTHELREASFHDPLTGLRNRRFLSDVLDEEIRAFISKRKYEVSHPPKRKNHGIHSVFAIYLIDIDFFKSINDTYGHKTGDLFLSAFARMLKNSVRQDDAVIRWGGEEFLVILKNTHRSFVDQYALKLFDLLRKTKFQLPEENSWTKDPSFSMGAAVIPVLEKAPDRFTIEQAIMLADHALYCAKNAGRARCMRIRFNEKITESDLSAKEIIALLSEPSSPEIFCEEIARLH